MSDLSLGQTIGSRELTSDQGSALRVFHAIHSIQREFIRSHDSAPAFRMLTEQLLSLTGSEYSFVGAVVVSPGGRPGFSLEALRWAETAAARVGQSGISTSEMNRVLSELLQPEKPIFYDKARHGPRQDCLGLDARPLHSYAIYPLRRGAEFVGAIGLGNRAGGYSRELTDALEPILGTAAILVDTFRSRNKQLYIEESYGVQGRLRDAMLENALDAIISIDDDGKIVEFNPAAQTTFGWARSEVIGKPVSEIVFPENAGDHNAFRQDFSELNRSGQSTVLGRHFETVARRRGGDVFAVEMAITMTLIDGKPIYTAFARDITDRRRRVAELREAKNIAEDASKAKSTFVASVSHEIRTPLNAIDGALRLIDPSALPERDNELLQLAKNANEDLLTIVDDVLDFAKFEAGQLNLESGDTPSAYLIGSVLDSLTLRGDVHDRNITSFIAAGVPRIVHTDERRVRQILLNFVRNALQHSGGNRVHISLKLTDDGALRFSVRDDGRGISRSDQNKLFSEFAQLPSAPGARRNGTGLGLAISKKIAELLGGEIGVNTRAGRGAEFWFTIPDRAGSTPGGRRSMADGLDTLSALVVGGAKTTESLATQLDAWGVTIARILSAVEAASLSPHDLTGTTLLFFASDELPGKLADEIRSYAAQEKTRTVVIRSDFCGTSNGDCIDADHRLTLPLLPDRLHAICAAAAGQNVEERPDNMSTSEGRIDLSGLRVLLVEDSDVNRKVAAAQLKKFGADVDAVASGEQAISALSHLHYDVVLMDLSLPRMDGIAASRRIRRIPGVRGQVPIIALSADITAEKREVCAQAGMNEYLLKPVDAARMLHTVMRWARHDGARASGPQIVSQSLRKSDQTRVIATSQSPELVSLFVDELHGQRRVIETAVAELDLDCLALESLMLKNSAGSFGAIRVQKLADDLYAACRSGSSRQALEIADRLLDEIEPSIAALKAGPSDVHRV